MAKLTPMAPLPEAPDLSTSTPRKAAAAAVIVVIAAITVVYTFGAWNPREYVVLKESFENPWQGALLGSILCYAAVSLLLPLRNSAVQRGRIMARVVVVALFGVSLFGWGLTNARFGYEGEEIGRNAEGNRIVAIVDEPKMKDPELRIWIGSGLTRREVGTVGQACGSAGSIDVEFRGRDVFVLDTTYGDFEIRLDPDTGEPLDALIRCTEAAPVR